MTLGLPERIEANISPEPNSGCWLWTGGLRDKKDGYGGVGWNKQTWRTHKLVYTLLVGPVAEGLDLDHKCRVRLCCNPEHLEPVPRKENIYRGEGVAKHNRLKTHCRHGHEFTPENTYFFTNRNSIQRNCKACHNRVTLSSYHARKAAL